MALTAEEKKRLDKLGFANGGGYSDFLTGVQKQNPSTDKFLFIGKPKFIKKLSVRRIR